MEVRLVSRKLRALTLQEYLVGLGCEYKGDAPNLVWKQLEGVMGDWSPDPVVVKLMVIEVMTRNWYEPEELMPLVYFRTDPTPEQNSEALRVLRLHPPKSGAGG